MKTNVHNNKPKPTISEYESTKLQNIADNRILLDKIKGCSDVDKLMDEWQKELREKKMKEASNKNQVERLLTTFARHVNLLMTALSCPPSVEGASTSICMVNLPLLLKI